MCPLNRNIRWIEVSAPRRSAMYYSNWKFNRYLVNCPLNGRCPLFRLSVNRGSTVHQTLMRFTPISTSWLRGCSAGAWWSVYWHSYHLFQRSQRYYSCCFLVIDGHSSFRAQLVAVQKVRSTKLGASLPLWSDTFSEFLTNSCLCSFFKENCYTLLPTHLQLMCHPSTCTDEWLPTASTLYPSVFPAKKHMR